MRRKRSSSRRHHWLVAATMTLAATAFAQPIDAAAADQQPAAVRTTNLRIMPHWTDAEHFWFRRENDRGVTETVHVDAATGEMTIEDVNGDQVAKSALALSGGAVPRSGPSDDATEVEFVNQTDQPVELLWVDGSGRRKTYGRVARENRFDNTPTSAMSGVATGDDDTFYGSVTAGPAPHKVHIQQTFPVSSDNAAGGTPRPRAPRNGRFGSTMENWSDGLETMPPMTRIGTRSNRSTTRSRETTRSSDPKFLRWESHCSVEANAGANISACSRPSHLHAAVAGPNCMSAPMNFPAIAWTPMN